MSKFKIWIPGKGLLYPFGILIVLFLIFFFIHTGEYKIEKIETNPTLKGIGNHSLDPGIEKAINQYPSYHNLVMAGYQGWFAAAGDSSNRGWYHYGNNCGFYPGCSSIDFWPDMKEYPKQYISPFKFPDGEAAYLYSPFDEESVDLHFKWMRDYGIDGVHMQRFLVEVIKGGGKRHFNKVLENALKAASKYGRAISIMYDLSGSTSGQLPLLIKDWEELKSKFDLYDEQVNPTYLRHNNNPLVSIWGVGFKGREYDLNDVKMLLDELQSNTEKPSIMLGVPYYWRSLGRDTQNSPLLHDIIRQVDIIMPWAVGRYNHQKYSNKELIKDIKWCNENNIDYVPVVFPGFSWANLHKDLSLLNQISREKGDFFWKQVAGAKTGGAKSLYIAMFDEIDEGTAIFKVLKREDVPLNGNFKFNGIETGLETDHYLWLAGNAARWFHGTMGYDHRQPKRIKSN